MPVATVPLHMRICLPGSSPSSPTTELMPHYILLTEGKGWVSPHPQVETLGVIHFSSAA